MILLSEGRVIGHEMVLINQSGQKTCASKRKGALQQQQLRGLSVGCP